VGTHPPRFFSAGARGLREKFIGSMAPPDGAPWVPEGLSRYLGMPWGERSILFVEGRD